MKRLSQPSAQMKMAATGFTIKSGWACAVLVAGPAGSPSVVDARTIELCNPDVPDSRQPYHAGFGTARAAGPRLSTLVAGVKRFGRRSTAQLLREYQRAGWELKGAGLVVGSLIDPADIANDHIRIHALEGQLFRGVVKDAVENGGLACSIWRERDLDGVAATILGKSEPELRRAVADLGRGVGGPWRSEQKRAALAGWLLLAAAPPQVRPLRQRRSRGEPSGST
jgi:hypothetical protein